MPLASAVTAQRWRSYMEDRAARSSSKGVGVAPNFSDGETARTGTGTGTGTGTSTREEPKTKTARKRAAPSVLVSVEDMEDEGVARQHASDWLVARKAKDLPLTVTAWEKTKLEAIKANLTIAAAIQTAAENGWAGFKASWLATIDAPRGQAPAAVTTPSTDHRADSFLADQDQRAKEATRPPAAVLELARKSVRTA